MSTARTLDLALEIQKTHYGVICFIMTVESFLGIIEALMEDSGDIFIHV